MRKKDEALRFIMAYFEERGQTEGNRAYAFAKEAYAEPFYLAPVRWLDIAKRLRAIHGMGEGYDFSAILEAIAILESGVTASAATPVTNTSHDFEPDGGVLRFECHPGGEAPHVHTTCSKCGARAWFLEYQWELLAKGCPSDAPKPTAATLAASKEFHQAVQGRHVLLAANIAVACMRSEKKEHPRTAYILLAWEAAALSEGQVAKALGVDRVTAREMKEAAVREGVKALE